MEIENILVVDDTEINIDILLELLSGSYEVSVATTGQIALEVVEEEKIDLILLDIIMPDMDGYEVCKQLKSNEKTKEIPVIFITAKSDEDSIEKAYDIGGSDYVTKPFRPKELMARVRKELQLRRYQEELKFMASTDPMTKLYNRRYFSDISQQILALAKRDQTAVSLIMLDIDKFKNINDTYGHQAGDDAIIALSERLKAHQRKSDIICRFGGEEFVILLPETSMEQAAIVAEKIGADVEHTLLNIAPDTNINLTISLGVSQVNIDDETSIEPALNRADEALYVAKNAGRNRVSLSAKNRASDTTNHTD